MSLFMAIIILRSTHGINCLILQETLAEPSGVSIMLQFTIRLRNGYTPVSYPILVPLKVRIFPLSGRIILMTSRITENKIEQ